MNQQHIAHLFHTLAVLLEVQGENSFKIRAYENAARILSAMKDFDKQMETGQLKDVRGIGPHIYEKITEIVSTGGLRYLEEVKSSVPSGLVELLKIPSLGPRKIHTLYKELRITNLDMLEQAAHDGRLVDLEGFGLKTQQNILEGIAFVRSHAERFLLPDALAQAEQILAVLEAMPEVVAVSLAGSLRRCRETVKDIDIVAACTDQETVMNHFAGMEQVEKVIVRGSTKTSVRLYSGIQCDLRTVMVQEYPYALHHFTGSSEHNTAMRSRAKKLGIKMNEYGLFREDNSIIPCSTEEDVFRAVGLAYIPPELRENRGEIEAAENGTLPVLVTRQDIRGVVHCHTNLSDGAATAEEMINACIAQGFSYIGFADHSVAAGYAGGLEPEEVRAFFAYLDQLQQTCAPFRIFKGTEADILADGTVDYDEETLRLFDFVIASVHSRFKMNEREMTDRICRALENPYVTILGHPTGRLLLEREGYRVDMERILECAARNRKAIELNAHPSRLDLDWRYLHRAKELGVPVFINPDAHSTGGIMHVYLGVDVARKGWMEAADIGNAMGTDELAQYFENVRRQGRERHGT